MDLGSDAGSSSSSRSSSQSNSTKVTPCSECKSSSSPGGSLDLVSALEDYEAPFPVYQKVIDEWAPEEDREEEEEEDERGYQDDRCPARESGDLSARTRSGSGGARSVTTVTPLPMPNGNLRPYEPQDLRHNGNVVVAGRQSGPRGPGRVIQKPQPAEGRRGGRGPVAGAPCLQPPDGGTFVPEEPPVPPMDWEALEKHLAGLQFREQEVRNQGQARTNSTSVSWPGACPRAHTRVHTPHSLSRARARPRPIHHSGGGGGAGACFLLPWGTTVLSGRCLVCRMGGEEGGAARGQRKVGLVEPATGFYGITYGEEAVSHLPENKPREVLAPKPVPAGDFSNRTS